MEAALIDQVADLGALFNVRREPLFTNSGIQVAGKMAIVNETSNTVIGVVSDKYRVVTNHEVIENMQAALGESRLDTSGMHASVRMSHGGARSMIDVVLPAHQIKIANDVSRLQITVLNSYDGRWKYQSRAGAIRMACLNGQIFGSFVGSYSEFHNARLDPKAGALQLVEMAGAFNGAQDWWQQMIERKVDNEQVLRSIAIFLTGRSKIEDRENFLKLPTVRKLVDMFEAYSKEMGNNAYALYNALTDFVTHKKYRAETEAAALMTAQEQLRETINRQKIFEKV